MGHTRSFPLDDPAAGPLRAHRASNSAPTTTAPAAARWPVLARIAELNRASEPKIAEVPAVSRATYRVDTPHASAPAPIHPVAPAKPTPMLPAAVAPAATTSTAPDESHRQDRVLRAAPLPIRMALEAWHWIEPHQKLIRLAAMVTLMSAGGMAMFTVMHDEPHPLKTSVEPATTTVEAASVPKLEIQHAEHNPEIIPATGPAAELDTLEPTATGPLPPQSKPLMAVERDEPRTTLPYPTTVRPEPLEPIIAEGKLPQAQFDQEPAVARLKGTVEESQVR